MEVPMAFSRAQTAAAVSLSLNTLDRRIGDGTIRAVKVGRRVLIPATEVDRLLAGKTAVESGDQIG